MSGQELGTYQITVILEDLTGLSTSYPVLFQIECLPGSANPQCESEEEEPEETVASVIADDTDVTEVSSINSLTINIELTLDYEVVEIIPIDELVEPADPALEDDDDFEDVEGVLTAEQGAEAIEDIVTASDEPVEFDETLIPTGGLLRFLKRSEQTRLQKRFVSSKL